MAGGGLKNLDVLLDTVDEIASETVINAALEVQGTLRDNPPTGTPVDTGWARSNWTLSLDKPREDVVGSKENVVSTSQGMVEALQFDIRKNRSIWCVNNVPYIATLNNGHSKQSPPGFVDAVVDSLTLKYGKLK